MRKPPSALREVRFGAKCGTLCECEQSFSRFLLQQQQKKKKEEHQLSHTNGSEIA